MDVFNFAKTIPTWMDQSFFEKVIRQMENDPEAEVKSFNIRAGTTPGENFSSSLYRGVITYSSKFTEAETKVISVIIKTEIIETLPGLTEFLKDSPLFRNEIEMYDRVLPSVQELWLSVNNSETLSPK